MLLGQHAHPSLLSRCHPCSATQRADVGAYLNSTANAIASVLSGVGTGLGNDTLVQQAQVRRAAWMGCFCCAA